VRVGVRFVEYTWRGVVAGQEVGHVIEAAHQVSGSGRKSGASWPRRRVAVVGCRGEHDGARVPGSGEGPTAQEIRDALQDKANHRPTAISIAEGVWKETLLDEYGRRPSERLDLAPRT